MIDRAESRTEHALPAAVRFSVIVPTYERPAHIVAEFRALPVKPAVLERWLGGNAAALLGER